MRRQQAVWVQEHRTGEAIPSETGARAGGKPSSHVVAFFEFLKAQGVRVPLRVLDIGCGKGRNSIYLAKQGCDAWGIDYVPDALADMMRGAVTEEVGSRVHPTEGAIDEPWPFADGFFDVAVDCFSSIDIETPEGRAVYRSELHRTVRKGGYILVVVVAEDDEMESMLMRTAPGAEPHSSIWPNGKFQKNYDETELRELYQGFTILDLKKVERRAVKLGKDFLSRLYWLVLQNQ